MLRSCVKRVAAPALSRAYATPAVVSTQASSPTAAISVVVKAGARYEPAPGLAHVLKNSVFKSTNKRSQIRLVREAEMLGGVLSSTLSREHLILTAEFMKGDEAFFAELLGDALVQAKFSPHEYNEEVIPRVAADYEQAIHDPTTYSFDVAHQLAFRAGLGNSLYASPHTAVEYSAATAFARSAFSSPSNFAVVSSGVDESQIKSLVGEFFTASSSSSSASGGGASLSASPASYHGGELRVPSVGHSSVDHFLLGFQGQPTSSVELVVLRHLLGGESSIKWSPGASPLSKLAPDVTKTSVKAFNLSYSDAGLFGVYVTAPTNDVADLLTKAVAEIKAVANKAPSGDAVKQAVLKAKFAAAAAHESRVGSLELVGAQLANSGSAPSLEDTFAKLDKVSAESLTKAAATLLKSKPTTVAYGNTHKLPYADGLGL